MTQSVQPVQCTSSLVSPSICSIIILRYMMKGLPLTTILVSSELQLTIVIERSAILFLVMFINRVHNTQYYYCKFIACICSFITFCSLLVCLALFYIYILGRIIVAIYRRHYTLKTHDRRVLSLAQVGKNKRCKNIHRLQIYGL